VSRLGSFRGLKGHRKLASDEVAGERKKHQPRPARDAGFPSVSAFPVSFQDRMVFSCLQAPCAWLISVVAPRPENPHFFQPKNFILHPIRAKPIAFLALMGKV
jgi:hypothetical protein